MSAARRLAVLATTTLLLGVASCGGGASDDTGAGSDAPQFSTEVSGDLKAWGFDNADDVGKARLDYAKSQLSGVSIAVDQTGFDAQKFTTRLASGDVPDVVQMDRGLVATFAAQDLLLPLDECFTANGVDARQHWYPAVVDDVTWQDKTWAVPQFFQPAAVMVDTKALDDAGVSTEDIDTSKPDVLLAAAKKLYRSADGKPTRLGFDAVPTGQTPLWLVGSGGRTVGDDGRPALDDPANVAAFTTIKALVDAQGGWAKVKSFSDSFDFFGDNNQFVKGQVAAQIDAQWYVNVLSPYAGDISLGAVPFRGSDGQPFAISGGTAFVVPAKAKNPSAACAWALKLTADEAWKAAAQARAATLASKSGAINTGLFTGSPSADQAIRSQFVKSSGNAGFDQTIKTYYDVVASGKSAGASPAGQAISTELANALTATLLGQKSPQQALTDAQAAANRAYDQIVG